MFLPAGAFLLWAIQKSLSGDGDVRAESLSGKECKIYVPFSRIDGGCQEERIEKKRSLFWFLGYPDFILDE